MIKTRWCFPHAIFFFFSSHFDNKMITNHNYEIIPAKPRAEVPEDNMYAGNELRLAEYLAQN